MANKEVSMDRGRRALRALNESRRHISFSGGKKRESQLRSAEQELKKLDETVVEDQSQLIRYRQNFTVPAVWVPQQGIRISNIPEIPPEKIMNLSTYIQANVTRIDGGNIEVD
jgi:capsule polysaccharide export protein KpsE/RkpR